MENFHCQTCMKIETIDDVLHAMEETDHLAKSIGFMPNDQLLLQLVTEEAVVNAREYSEMIGEGIVEIQWDVSNQEIVISVKQKGTFFEICKKEEVNVERRGRGLQLILAIMDKVWLEQCEANMITLHMKKNKDYFGE